MTGSSSQSTQRSSVVPLWLKLATTAFTAVLIPIYWVEHGPANFLWISDIAWFAAVFILWRGSRLLNSMMLLGALPFELYWNAAYLLQLTTGLRLGGVVDYMFDPTLSLGIRALSLFHVPLPFILLWLFGKWGYDPRALKFQTAFLVPIVLLPYFLSDPDENINWVHSPHVLGWDWMPGPLWLALYLALVPTLVYWPLHKVFRKLAPA